jgi:UDP-N-acetylbacillosamine N-acetyltransferase
VFKIWPFLVRDPSIALIVEYKKVPGAKVGEMNMKLVILGAGGYGRTIKDIVEQEKEYTKTFILDDSFEEEKNRTSNFKNFIDSETDFYPAFGNNELRLRWIEKILSFNGRVTSIISSHAYISPTVQIGTGSSVLPNACVGTNTIIGSGVIVNMGALIDHDCLIDDGVHIAPGAIVKGQNHILRCEKVESGVVIERTNK